MSSKPPPITIEHDDFLRELNEAWEKGYLEAKAGKPMSVPATRARPEAASSDASRMQFLVKHWNSIYKGKPLWRFLEEDSLRVGGLIACIDEAMAVAKSEPQRGKDGL